MQILVCKIPKIETRDPFHSVRVRVCKNKKMKLKNFKALIVTAQSAVEIALQKFFAGAETCNTLMDASSRDPPSNTRIIIKLILYLCLVRRVWLSSDSLVDFLA